MKPNQALKKSNDYYESVKARYDDMNRELEATQTELAAAQAEYDREKAIHQKIKDSVGKFSLNSTSIERDQLDVLSLAHNRVGSLKDSIERFRPRFQELRRIIEAPQRFEQAQAELIGLVAQRKSLSEERTATETLVDKISQRVADLEASILSGENSAANLLVDSNVDFNVPESLIKFELELRLAKPSLADTQNKLADILDRTKELQKAIQESERIFVDARFAMVEIELHEHLLPIMNLFARAAVAKYQFNDSADLSQFAIDIPPELIAPAGLELAAELPSA